MKNLIEISNFCKKYQNDEIVMKDIIINNKITLLIGKNGSGKSTLLKAIGGLIKYCGTIKTTGKITYMSEFTSFPPDLTIKEFVFSLNNISKHKKSEEELLLLIKIFNLNTKINALLSSLSKGMKAKLNLVQVLMENSDIYLLDEPINGLDSDGVNCLINFIVNSNKCFVISTHLIDDFKTLKSEVIKL